MTKRVLTEGERRAIRAAVKQQLRFEHPHKSNKDLRDDIEREYNRRVLALTTTIEAPPPVVQPAAESQLVAELPAPAPPKRKDKWKGSLIVPPGVSQ